MAVLTEITSARMLHLPSRPVWLYAEEVYYSLSFKIVKRAKCRGFWGKRRVLYEAGINSLNSFQLMAWFMHFCTATEINKELYI